MTVVRWLALALALLCAAPARADEQVGAADLITNMQKAVAVVGRQAQNGGANPADARQKPFFGALKQADTSFNALAATFKVKGNPYFRALNQAGRAVGQVEATFALSGINNPGISDAVQKLGQNYDLLRDNFSPEALRQRQGGALTSQEAAQMQALLQQNQTLQAQLAALQQKVQSQEALAAQVEQMRQQSQALASNQANLQGYLASLRQASDLEARMRGVEQYVRQNYPGSAPDFQGAGAAFVLGGFITAATNGWRFGPPAWSNWNGVPVNLNPTYNVNWNQSWGNFQNYQNYVQQSYDQQWTEVNDNSQNDVVYPGSEAPGEVNPDITGEGSGPGNASETDSGASEGDGGGTAPSQPELPGGAEDPGGDDADMGGGDE